jgi:hypothetical protein
VRMVMHVFCFDLPHSDAPFVKAYPAETTEAFLDGHVSAFAFFGGVPLSATSRICRRASGSATVFSQSRRSQPSC